MVLSSLWFFLLIIRVVQPLQQCVGHRRRATVRAAVSIFEESEVLEAMEEALVAGRPLSTHEAQVNANWDGAFWQELDEASLLAGCSSEKSRRRLAQFFRGHRLMAMTLSQGRNRTDMALRRGDISETEDPFFAYPGLPLPGKERWPFLGDVEEAARKDMSELTSAFEDLAYGKKRLEALRTSSNDDMKVAEEEKERELNLELMALEGVAGPFKTATGEYDEIVDDGGSWTEPESTDASIEASFAALDRLDDDDEEEDTEDVGKKKKTTTTTAADDDIFGDLDDDFIEDLIAREEEEDLPKQATQEILLSSYFRHDELASARFPNLLEALPPSYYASILRIGPKEQPPLKRLKKPACFLTCYLRLGGDPENSGLRTDSTSYRDTTVLLEANCKHAPFNDGNQDAIFLTLDYWHPSLDPAEIDALHKFFYLDEQFVLRRYDPTEVLPLILALPAPLLDDDEEDQ